MLGLATTKTRDLFDADTYTETRPEYALYAQDDFRVTSRLTLNLGLRWDVYVPWIEVDDRQSNFDETTGQFIVASDDAMIDGRRGRALPADLLEGRLRPALRVCLRLDRRRQTIIRGGFGMFWNFTPGGTSSSKAQNPPFLQSTALNADPTAYGGNLLLKDGLPRLRGRSDRPAAGTTRSIFDINFRDAYARNGT